MNQVIEQRIRRRGGILSTENMPPEFGKSINYVKSRANSLIEHLRDQIRNLGPIEFDIIDNYAFNAFATGHNSEYFIGVNRGTIATLGLVFDRMLADKNVLKFIGDNTIEDDDLPLLDNLTMNFEATVDMLPRFNPPKCPTRNYFSKHFSRMALDFIISHEITHIINGHVDMGKSLHNMHLEEIGMNNDTSIEKGMISKSFELDADTWATKMLLSSEIRRCFGENPLPSKEAKDFYSRPGMVLMQFSIVLATIFRIFGDQRLNTVSFETDTYPKPRLRFVISKLIIAQEEDFLRLNSKMNFDLDEFGVPIIVGPSFNLIEEAFETITGIQRNSTSSSEARSDVGISQINSVIRYWNNNLIDSLKRFSYIKTLPKNEYSSR